MVATVVALGATVALAVYYVLASERLDAGSLPRRRLDAWVFAGAVTCLTAMLYGGAEVARSVALRSERLSAPSAPVVVERKYPVSLVLGDARRSGDGDEAGDAIAADAWPVEEQAVVAEAVVSGGNDDTPYVALRGERPNRSARSGPRPPLASSEASVLDTGAYTPALGVQPPSGTDVPIQPIVVVPPTVAPPPAPTGEPPTVPAPTLVPTPMPSPTPFCGDPGEITLDLDVLDASIEREGATGTVRYRAQVHNRSRFPVDLVDIHVTLEGRDSGSERFGHVQLPDVQVDPSVVHALEGTMALTKSPSPFGTTQLCVSLVTETCGQSLPYHLTKRCLVARGF